LEFDSPCFGWYASDRTFYTDRGITINSGLLIAPLKQQAFDWFRTVHKLKGEIYLSGDCDDRYTFRVHNTFYPHQTVGVGEEYTYEEAQLFCIDALINLVKKKI
jgi:hypothetical protein